jgi:hypothetical protein
MLLASLIAVAAATLSPSVASADERCSSTISVASPGSSIPSTVYMCIQTAFTQQATASDPLPVVSGDQPVSATLHWDPEVAQVGDERGCSGQRKTPSGCVTWSVSGQYLLTHLYDNPLNSDVYPFTWHTQCLPRSNLACLPQNGPATLTAQISLNQTPLSLSVPVDIENTLPAPIISPNAWNDGKLPVFKQTSPFVIAATGDGAAGAIMGAKVEQMMAGWNPDMLMYLGDVYQRGGTEEFLNFYDPVFGQLRHITAPTPGNHEYKCRMLSAKPGCYSAEPYFWYWNYPISGPTQPGGGGQYYSFNAGGWHIISLDANILPMDNIQSFSTTPQGQWLKADLAANKTRCTLAFWHQERFSDISLRLPQTSAFWISLYANNVDLIVNAHAHAYERWRPLNAGGQLDSARGMTQLVVGTGGNVLAEQWQTQDTRSAFRKNTNWGALKLTLRPGYAQYAFYSPQKNTTGEPAANDPTVPLDMGTVPCH